MRLTIVGCSGSFPGPATTSSCYLVQADGFCLVVDLGNGSLGQLQRYCGLDDIDAVLLSHLHADHCMDLLPLYLTQAYGRSDPPGLDACFEFVEWTAGTHAIGPFSVTVGKVAHPIETWGIRIAHAGASITYSADTGPCDALVELSRGTDLALFESSFEAGRDDAAPRDLHMTGGEAGQQAEAAGAGRLLLTHLPPWNDPQVSLEAGRAAFSGPVEVAAPGATYDL